MLICWICCILTSESNRVELESRTLKHVTKKKKKKLIKNILTQNFNVLTKSKQSPPWWGSVPDLGTVGMCHFTGPPPTKETFLFACQKGLEQRFVGLHHYTAPGLHLGKSSDGRDIHSQLLILSESAFNSFQDEPGCLGASRIQSDDLNRTNWPFIRAMWRLFSNS